MRKSIGLIGTALMVVALATAIEAQSVRVHLKNGDFMDGSKATQTKTSVILEIPFGSITFSKEDVLNIEHLDRQRVVIPVTPAVVNDTSEPPQTTPPSKTGQTPSPPSGTQPQPDPATATQSQKKPPIQEPKTDAELFDAMLESDGDQRYEFMDKIVQKGEPMVALILKDLENLGGDKAAWAITALGRLRDTKAIGPIGRRIHDASPNVRAATISALVALGAKEYASEVRILLEDKEPTVRLHAIEALSTAFSDKESLETIAGLILDADSRVSGAAANAALGLAKKTDAVPELMKILLEIVEKADETARLHLVKVIGQMARPEAVEALLGMLNSDSKDLRAEVIIALGELAGKAVLSSVSKKEITDALLERLTSEEERWVRIQLCTALQRIKDQRVVPNLIALLRDEDTEIQNAASRSLMALTKQSFGLNADRWEEWWNRISEKQ